MDKIKVKCAFCGEEKEVAKKAEPKTNREKKEISFRCKCGGVNLRDGTAVWLKRKPPMADDDPPEPAKPKVKDAPQLLPKETGGPWLLLSVLLGVISFAAFVFLGKRKAKPEEKSSESPQDPFKVIN